MKNQEVDLEGARAWARKGVEEFLRDFPRIEAVLPVEDCELDELLTKLSELHAMEPRLDPHQQEDLLRYELSREWYRGLALSSSVPKASPYVAEVEKLIEAAATKLAAYEALSDHAAELISDNRVMIPQLRIFAAEVLRRERERPSGRGTPKVHPSRNRMIYALLLEIVDQFGVPPTRNKATPAGMSACDIVAEEMPNEARLPKTYSALEQIWLAGPREEEKFDDRITRLAEEDR